MKTKETLFIPARNVAGSRINVDGEIEEVAHGEVLPFTRWLKNVQPLDNQHVGSSDNDLGVGDDVVAQVRVKRCADLGDSALHGGDKTEERPTIVGLGKALAFHQSQALKLCIWSEEAVGRDQFNVRCVLPTREQFSQEASGCRLADSDRTGDADHERSSTCPFAQKVACCSMEKACPSRVEVHESAEGQIDLFNLAHIQWVA